MLQLRQGWQRLHRWFYTTTATVLRSDGDCSEIMATGLAERTAANWAGMAYAYPVQWQWRKGDGRWTTVWTCKTIAVPNQHHCHYLRARTLLGLGIKAIRIVYALAAIFSTKHVQRTKDESRMRCFSHRKEYSITPSRSPHACKQ